MIMDVQALVHVNINSERAPRYGDTFLQVTEFCVTPVNKLDFISPVYHTSLNTLTPINHKYCTITLKKYANILTAKLFYSRLPEIL